MSCYTGKKNGQSACSESDPRHSGHKSLTPRLCAYIFDALSSKHMRLSISMYIYSLKYFGIEKKKKGKRIYYYIKLNRVLHDDGVQNSQQCPASPLTIFLVIQSYIFRGRYYTCGLLKLSACCTIAS